MKIEIGAASTSQLDVERSARQVSSSNIGSSQGVAKDYTTLQSDSATVQSLVQQALSLPDVRQDKVDAVRQSVNSGQFQIDPQKIASAMIAESTQ